MRTRSIPLILETGVRLLQSFFHPVKSQVQSFNQANRRGWDSLPLSFALPSLEIVISNFSFFGLWNFQVETTRINSARATTSERARWWFLLFLSPFRHHWLARYRKFHFRSLELRSDVCLLLNYTCASEEEDEEGEDFLFTSNSPFAYGHRYSNQPRAAETTLLEEMCCFKHDLGNDIRISWMVLLVRWRQTVEFYDALIFR